MNLEEAKKLAESNNPEALYVLGRAYFDGKGVEANLNLAYEYLKKAADLNYPAAASDLGSFLLSGYKFKTDQKQAFSLLLKASELGANDVEENIRDCYHDGKAVKASKFNELKWHIRYLETESDYQNQLRLVYRCGAYISLTTDDLLEKLIEEAKKGDPNYLYYLGSYYYERLNYKEAFSNYLESAKKGNKIAQYNLATLYSDGRGTEINHEEAEKWYQESAKQDFAPAYLMVGAYRFKNIIEVDGEENDTDEESNVDEKNSIINVIKDFNKSYELGETDVLEELIEYFNYYIMEE